jgi:hypothetical protein
MWLSRKPVHISLLLRLFEHGGAALRLPFFPDTFSFLSHIPHTHLYPRNQRCRPTKAHHIPNPLLPSALQRAARKSPYHLGQRHQICFRQLRPSQVELALPPRRPRSPSSGPSPRVSVVGRTVAIVRRHPTSAPNRQ